MLLSGVFFSISSRRKKKIHRAEERNRTFLPTLQQRGVVICIKAKVFCEKREDSIVRFLVGTVYHKTLRTTDSRVLTSS